MSEEIFLITHLPKCPYVHNWSKRPRFPGAGLAFSENIMNRKKKKICIYFGMYTRIAWARGMHRYIVESWSYLNCFESPEYVVVSS